ncbi:MAG: permease [Acidobacteria bacterium]|nr:permease [Acidobacteriota bacterium]
MRLPPWMQWRCKSHFRGAVVTVSAVAIALKLAHFPLDRENWFNVLPALAIALSIIDTARCMRGRWSWYHGGVLFLLYAELMAFTLVAFLLLYPLWL